MTVRIPLAKPSITSLENSFVRSAVESGWVSSRGPYIEEFERAFGQHVGQTALSCSSGTAALHLALMALGVGPRDEVIVPDLTFAATASVVLHVGARPVLIDTDPYGLMTPQRVEEAITPRTRAIMPVHLYGQACDMPALMRLAKKHGLAVIEDACEALDTYCAGKHVGTFGDFGCFSFYANKHISTGEGGMVVCDKSYAGSIDLYRNGGFKPGSNDYYHPVAGLNYRMTNMQAALGCAQMERLADLMADRAAVVEVYRERLLGIGSWLFVADTVDRDAAAKRLAEAGVETRPVFRPLHTMPPFRLPGSFANAERLHRHGLCLPTGPHVSREEALQIAALVQPFQH